MPKSTDPILLALLATLEERARAKGEKSIVKAVVGRLAANGAPSPALAELEALRVKKSSAPKAAAKTAPAEEGKGKARKTKPANHEADALPE